MKNTLIIIFISLMLYMIYTTVSTSLESNLFEEWNFLASIPWMKATLIDFYINTVVIFAWVAYRENNLLKSTLWLISFILLGSMTTTLYVIIQLINLGKNEPVKYAFIKSK
jgi:hypothetical protein